MTSNINLLILHSFITQPNMYARGILFGKMKYELGDHSFIKCPELGLLADIEFKTKGWVGGTYNAIGGVIKEMKTEKILFQLSGFWNGEMFIQDAAVCCPRIIPKICTDKCFRLDKKLFSLMPRTLSTHLLPYGHLRNKPNENHSGFGLR